MKGYLSRRRFLADTVRWTAGLGAAGVLAPRLSAQVPAPRGADGAGKYNVLFIAADDLRPQLGCYGMPMMKTPHIDALAASGTLFNRAYCQQAVCSPSRTSLLTGRRPDTTRVYDLKTHFRTTIPDVVTLPQHFKQHGYESVGLGKLFHGALDDPASWTRSLWNVDPDHKSRGVPSWRALDVEDEEMFDGRLASAGIEHLRRLKDRPFFLGLGFRKPHLPFEAPRRYFDLYPESEITLARNPDAPQDVPAIAMHKFGELRNYSDIPGSGPVSDQKARELIRAYCAAVSFVDAQVGRVMAELDRLGLRERTIVVLWGDHGWHLGELSLWCKHTNFEIATRSPLIMRVPGQAHAGSRTEALVEFVDIYPTLCEAAGLELPAGLEGLSMLPVIADPDRPWKTAAFSQYPRGGNMGYSMRTDEYRYTEWKSPNRQTLARELYDHRQDPDETVNLASRPEHQDLVARLSRQLNAGWQAALPQ